MSCKCNARQPCPVHKDHPPPYPDIVLKEMVVIRVFHVWSTQTYHTTVTVDALSKFESAGFPLKSDAIGAALNYLKL